VNLLQAVRILGITLGVAGMSLGVALVFLGWKYHSMPASTTAVGLLLGCPAIALSAVLAAAPTPLPLEQRRRAERALRLIRSVRAHVCMAASYLAVLWFCQLGGLMAVRQFAVYYTVAIAVSLAGYLPWLSREERRVRAQWEDARRRVEDLKPAVSWAEK
jgi:hypothetical protein